MNFLATQAKPGQAGPKVRESAPAYGKPGQAGLKARESASADFSQVAREFIPAQIPARYSRDGWGIHSRTQSRAMDGKGDVAMKRLDVWMLCALCACLPGSLLAQDVPGTITSLTFAVNAIDTWGNIYSGGRLFYPDGTSKYYLATP